MFGKNIKLHKIRLTFKVHLIKLKVRFPCSISTLLKVSKFSPKIENE